MLHLLSDNVFRLSFFNFMEADIMNKITAIYVRRSVSDKDKDNNSLSIDSQKADCIKSLNNDEVYRI